MSGLEIKRITDAASPEAEPAGPERTPERVMEELSGEHYKPLLRFCVAKLKENRVTNPDEIALDVVQETMLKAWTNLGKMDPKQNVRAWLFKIAQNTIIDMQRKEKRRPLAEAESLSGTGVEEDGRPLEERIGMPSFEARLEAKEEIARLLPLLDSGNADLIKWKYVDGLNIGEIARNLHLGVDQAAGVIRAAEEQFNAKRLN